MLAWKFVRTVALGAAMAGLTLGCVVQNDPGPQGSSYGGGSGSSSGGTATPPTPMLVDVDPNETMNANPGDGVGIFVEYKTGGHWHVWWTCDTNKTGLGCAFSNTVTVATGSITNLVSQITGGDGASQPSPQKLTAVSNTTSSVDGITFDTPFSSGQTPIITLEVVLNGTQSVQFACPAGSSQQLCNNLFFVQDGQINGGFTGTLTDPLKLEPKTP